MNLTQLRRLALDCQGLSRQQPFGKGAAGALRAIEHLGYVQIDTISVIERAHHHVLWTRVPGYRPAHLAQLLQRRQVFEYWFHAAACLPMRDYRFALPRMEQVRREGHMWFADVDRRLMHEILARVRAEGPLRLRALRGQGRQAADEPEEGDRGRGRQQDEPGCESPAAGGGAADDGREGSDAAGGWSWGPVRKALDTLFMQGDLMIVAREGMEKVYDLRERVLPPEVDTREPTVHEYAAWLLDTHLRAHGVVNARQVLHLRPDTALRQALHELIEARVREGSLQALPAGALPGAYVDAGCVGQMLKAPPKRVQLLSPFDNLVIHRERLQQLFGFDYRLECYLPPARRVHGYFCLPILWGDCFVGRVDCKAHRAEGRFEVLRLFLDHSAIDRDSFQLQLAESLQRLALFNGCAAELRMRLPV